MALFRKKESKPAENIPSRISPWDERVEKMLRVKPMIDQMVSEIEMEMGLTFKRLADFNNQTAGEYCILSRYRTKYDIDITDWSVYLVKRREEEGLPRSVKAPDKTSEGTQEQNGSWDMDVQKMLRVRPVIDEMVLALKKERGLDYRRLADYDNLTQREFDIMKDYRNRFGIAVDDWTMYIIERDNVEGFESTFVKPRRNAKPPSVPPTKTERSLPQRESTSLKSEKSIPEKETLRQTDPMKKDRKGNMCRHCNGSGYRQIASKDKNALPGSYLYGKCPDCGGTGKR